MSKVCKISGKRPRKGNTISHSQKHSKRMFTPNVKKKKVMIDGKLVRIRISARALRSLEKQGKLG